MRPVRTPLPKDKQSPLQRAKMAEHIKNRMNSGITGQSRVVPTQTVTGPGPKPAAPVVAKPVAAPVAAPVAVPAAAAPMKKGGSVKKYSKGGSASKRADGCATKGKTKGKII